MKYDTLKKRLEKRLVLNGYGDYVSGLPVDAIRTGTRLVGCRIQENHGWRSRTAARRGYAPRKSTSYYATPAMLAAWWYEKVAPLANAKRRDALFKITPDALAALPPEAIEFLDGLVDQLDWGHDDAGNPAVLVSYGRRFLRCTCTGTGRAFLLRVPSGNVEGYPKNRIDTVADAVRWLTPDEIAKGAQAVQTA